MIKYASIIALLLGFTLDLLLGDPYWLWHPIRLVGNMIAAFEKVLRRIFPDTEQGQFVAGIFLVIAVTTLGAGIPAALLFGLYYWNFYIGLAAETILCYQMLAAKALKTESMRVHAALSAGDVEGARTAVSMIVGRDTQNLTQEGITKAAVETVAENTADGVIAPLLFMAIGGAPMGFFYKSVNTMDSMVGYKNDKYLYFGRAAAKFDDLLNWIPARLSALLMIATCPFTGLDAKNAWRIYRRDKRNHASPNSAHTEAVAAGALGVSLAGDAWYFGKLLKKKTIGDPIREIEVEDIRRANRLMYAAALAGILLFGGVKFLICALL